MSAQSRIIAIDGPAGSGKSTTARLVARRLGMIFLDTGAMYRAVTLRALETAVPLTDGKALGGMAAGLRIEFREAAQGQRVLLDGRDVTAAIREAGVTAAVSQVSAHAQVRQVLVALQKQMGVRSALVAEGRDTTSVVFADACLKVYLTASLEERARRRQLELATAGVASTLEEQIENLRARDEYDSGRSVSPLKLMPDAVIVDTTSLSIEEQVDKVVALYEKRCRE